MSDRKKKEEPVIKEDGDKWLKELNDKPAPTYVKPVKKADIVYYTTRKWKGVKDVFCCNQCTWQEDIEDNIKLHVLSHYLEPEREAILDKLTKEKQNG